MVYSRTGELRRLGIILAAILVLLMIEGRGWAEAAKADPNQLMPIAGGVLFEAGQHHWDKAAAELEQFEAVWKALNLSSAAGADGISAAIAETKKALTDAGANPDKAYQAFSKLTKATDDFVADKSAVQNSGDAKVLAKGLLPTLQQTLTAISQSDWVKANSEYKQFQTQWKKIESSVIKDNIEAYRSMEVQITLARVSLQVEPPKAGTANNAVSDLIRSLEDYIDGQATAAAIPPVGKQTVSDLMKILQTAEDDLNAQQPETAAKQMQTFISLWPTAEGEVKSRSSSTYADIENKMSEASSYLLSSPPRVDDAKKTIAEMLGQLGPYKNKSSYTAWDAGLILLRDGVEALLIIAAFLAFMHRTGNGSKQKWVWCGAGTGLVLSGVLALLLTYTIVMWPQAARESSLKGLQASSRLSS